MSRPLQRIILTLAAVSLAGIASGAVLHPIPGGLDDNTTQSEAHIAVWGNVIVAGWNDARDGNVETGPRTWYNSSLDSGQTWGESAPVPVDPGPLQLSSGWNRGDPVVAVDNAGTFYIATIAQTALYLNYIGVVKSNALSLSSPGVTFGTPLLVSGPNLLSPLYLQDKPWIAVDATSSAYSGRVYLCWKDYYDESLRFVRSTSTNPLQFGTSKVLSSSGKGCNIGIGPSGEVYATWITGMGTNAQAIYIVKSTNGGDDFGIEVSVVPSSSSSTPPVRSGDEAASTACDKRALGGNIRVPDWPLIAVDRSGGPNNGTVYIAYNADPDGAGSDEADVFVVRSPASLTALGSGDPGATWSAPVAINKAPAAVQGADSTSNDNWMPAITVASNGTVAVSFYDRRLDSGTADGDPANTRIHVFAATSTDRGSTWVNAQLTSTSFGVPPLLPSFDSFLEDCYMGDYNGIAAAGTAFHLVWGDNSNTITTANNPLGRSDPDVVYSALDGRCIFVSWIQWSRTCREAEPNWFYRDGMIVRFPDPKWAWIDPLDKNCFYKWSCPPCSVGPDGYCPSTYVITFDFARAGLDPEVVALRLLDSRGRDITSARTVAGRKIFSFRPKGFRAGGADEQMFFLITRGPRGRIGTDYRIPVRLEVRP